MTDRIVIFVADYALCLFVAVNLLLIFRYQQSDLLGYWAIDWARFNVPPNTL